MQTMEVIWLAAAVGVVRGAAPGWEASSNAPEYAEPTASFPLWPCVHSTVNDGVTPAKDDSYFLPSHKP